MKPIDVELMRTLFDYAPDVGGSCLLWKNPRAVRMKPGTMAGADSKAGYWRVCVKGKYYVAHRLVWAVVNGEDPQKQIDHVDGNKSNNQITNLRLATNGAADNTQNKKKYTNNSSGYSGVSRRVKSNRERWYAYIDKDKKRRHLGVFDTPEEAYGAYLKAKAELHSFQPIPRQEKAYGLTA